MAAEIPVSRDNLLLPLIFSYASSSIADPVYAVNSTSSRLASTINLRGNSSGENSNMPYDGAMIPHNPFKNNKQFVKLEQSFLDQLHNHADTFNNESEYFLKEKMKLSTEAILGCSPDRASLDITWDGSIFYKVIKNDLTIHFEHFLITEFDGSDEAIMTIYKGDVQVLNYGDTLANTVAALGSFFISYKIDVPELA